MPRSRTATILLYLGASYGLLGETAAAAPGDSGKLEESETLCKRIKFDVAEYYGKQQTLIVSASADDYYNYKYAERQKSHYSFRVSCGELQFHAYGAKQKSEDLFEYLLADDTRPVELTVVTDKSHGDRDIFTLVGWRKLHDDVETPVAPRSREETTRDTCIRMKKVIASYWGKPQVLFAPTTLSDYYNYKYGESYATHYAFKIDCGKGNIIAYGAKSRFKDLWEFLLEHPGQRVEVTVVTDRSHEDKSIFTLLSWKKP